ncbi:hypothetical protein DPMN_181179 [Dreissena polymorpha]|uniref:Uncharacterized protein n=1 Tax=Dreissena polymorpha TaxID=45954 RepID=A0A9D4DD09_DREPO|nr:hypothetical protein DPMN_181179 [Dreissena polymorpha]
MPQVKCPIPGCDYETPDYKAPIVAALLNTRFISQLFLIKRVKFSTITSAGTSEEWHIPRAGGMTRKKPTR